MTPDEHDALVWEDWCRRVRIMTPADLAEIRATISTPMARRITFEAPVTMAADIIRLADEVARLTDELAEARRQADVRIALDPGPHHHRFTWSAGTTVLEKPPM